LYKSYPLSGYDKDDYRTYPCDLPQTIRLDVARMFGGTIDEVEGKNITIKNPDESYSWGSIDNTGYIEFEVTELGQYELDLSSIRPHSRAIFTVSGD